MIKFCNFIYSIAHTKFKSMQGRENGGCVECVSAGPRLESPNLYVKLVRDVRRRNLSIFFFYKSSKIIYKNLGGGSKKKLCTRAPRYHCTTLSLWQVQYQTVALGESSRNNFAASDFRHNITDAPSDTNYIKFSFRYSVEKPISVSNSKEYHKLLLH
jgi:hypothetical protein